MENTFVKYQDLLTIEGYDENSNKEEFKFIPIEDELLIGRYQNKCNMREYGEQIPVRNSVYLKLKNAAKKLNEMNPNYRLVVVYGFRALEMQQKYFDELLEEVNGKFDDEIEMYEYIHEKIAVPSVAGHPTGGAVDIAIWDDEINDIIDFGSKILDWDTIKCYYNSKDISEEARKNRNLLRELLINENFAPYDGEWWHFSYGDKEWAFYYGKEKALYNQVSSNEVYKIQ